MIQCSITHLETNLVACHYPSCGMENFSFLSSISIPVVASLYTFCTHNTSFEGICFAFIRVIRESCATKSKAFHRSRKHFADDFLVFFARTRKFLRLKRFAPTATTFLSPFWVREISTALSSLEVKILWKRRVTWEQILMGQGWRAG